MSLSRPRPLVLAEPAGRRRLLAMAALAPLVLLGARRAAAQVAAACYDPAALPLSQKSRRRSLGYTETSSSPARRCGLCAFYTAGEGGCGICQLLAGGPVNAAAGCTSFAAKAG